MSTRCITPIRLNTGIDVPCGDCPRCHARRISGWSFRLLMEEKYCSSAVFLTLTYARENLPRTPMLKMSKDELANVSRSKLSGLSTLFKRDVQLFVKRLRRSTPWGNNIKYFACGEYGSTYGRPHYHMLLFNAPVQNVADCWQLGYVHYGSVSGASVGYCLKYMCKQGIVPRFKGDNRLQEFGLFSQRLGLAYLTPEMIRWHHEDLYGRCYIPLEGGKKIPMPRYFKEKIYNKGQRRAIELHMQMLCDQQYREEMVNARYVYQNPVYEESLSSRLRQRSAFQSLNMNADKERRLYFQKASIF